MPDRAVAVLAAGAGVLSGARRVVRGRPAPADVPGRLVDVLGTRLHVLAGEREQGTGCTVLLESALASPCTGWAWVTRGLDGRAHVIAYDRAGNGWSDPAAPDLPRTVERAAAVLDACGAADRVVVVGHSVGGLVARAVAGRFPVRVAGLVLVDSSHPDQLARSAAQRDALPDARHAMDATRRAARRGAIGPTADFGAVAQLPDVVRRRTVERLRRPEPWAGACAELRAWEHGWSAAVREVPLPPDLPLAVVTAGEQARMDPVHARLQEELAGLSRRSRHDTVAGTTHDALVLSPDGAAAVIEAIAWVLAAAGPSTEGENTS